jgi:hypothetical protein
MIYLLFIVECSTFTGEGTSPVILFSKITQIQAVDLGYLPSFGLVKHLQKLLINN